MFKYLLGFENLVRVIVNLNIYWKQQQIYDNKNKFKTNYIT